MEAVDCPTVAGIGRTEVWKMAERYCCTAWMSLLWAVFWLLVAFLAADLDLGLLKVYRRVVESVQESPVAVYAHRQGGYLMLFSAATLLW